MLDAELGVADNNLYTGQLAYSLPLVRSPPVQIQGNSAPMGIHNFLNPMKYNLDQSPNKNRIVFRLLKYHFVILVLSKLL